MIFYIFLITGIISIIIGIIFLIKPELLIKVSEICNKDILTDEQILGHPKILGVFILFVNIIILLVAIHYKDLIIL
jgi:hypothetical protein